MRGAFRISSLATAIALFGGCGGGQAPLAAPAPPPVDPRFVSADAILAHYNELVTGGTRVQLRKTLDLIYAETDVQKRLLTLVRDTLPALELEQAVWDRFGEGLDPASKEAPLSIQTRPASMTERAPQRAQAIEPDADGSDQTIYFVKMDDRWWISAYTLEYDPEFADAIELLDDMPPFTRDADWVNGFTRRVESGEFKSAEDVRTAIFAEVAERTMQEMQRRQGAPGGTSRSLSGG